MLASWNIAHERLRASTLHTARLPIAAAASSLQQEPGVVNIVEDQDLFRFRIIPQPVVHELDYIRLWVLPARRLDAARDALIALLEPRRIARVHPEHPRLRRSLTGLIRVFDGKLRLTSSQSVSGRRQIVPTHPTPPSPTSAVREPGTAHFVWSWSNVFLLTKSASRSKGIVEDGRGGVSGRSK